MPEKETFELLVVPRERSIKAGYIDFDYKLIWKLAFCLLGLCLIIVGSQMNHAVVGFSLAIMLALLYVGFIGFQPYDRMQTTLLARLFRSSRQWLMNLRGGTYNSDQPARGEAFGAKATKPKLPKPLAQIGRVEFIPHIRAGGVLGIAFDRSYGSYSATMLAHGSSLLSLDERTKKERMGAFAQLLNTMAELSNHVYRFAWREQTLIGEELKSESLYRSIRDAAQLNRDNPPNKDVFLAETMRMGASSIVHRTTLTLSIDAKQSARKAKQAGGPEEVLVAQLQSFHAAATGGELGRSPIGLKAATYLSYNDLLFENRLALDPVYAQSLWQQRSQLGEDHELHDQQLAWPGYANFEAPDHCQLGQTYHMGFYISELTRTGMPPDQFWSILKLQVPKTVITVFEMVPSARAARFAQWSTTGETGTNADRLASSQRVTASQHLSAEAAATHEMEIASNLGQVGRVRCYIDLTGSSLEAVRTSASLLRHAAAEARMMVEPLDGRQHLGITAAMPIGRGLATLSPPGWL